MNEIDSMRDFLITRQLAFNEACCAFANSENMTRLAESLGMSAVMLRNKLNPEQPHVLTCVELVAITKLSGNQTILNSLLLGLGVVTAQLPMDNTEDSFIKCALDNSIYAGELSRMAVESAGKHNLTRRQKHKIVQTAQASISSQVLLINRLVQCKRSCPFSMATDAIAIQEPVSFTEGEG